MLPSLVLGTPTLRFLDGKDIDYVSSASAQAAPIKMASVETNEGVQVTEGMEKEFAMGLRGEKDVSVVA